MSTLPPGWAQTTIGKIARIETGNTPSKSNANYYAREVCFFKPGDLDLGDVITHSVDMVSKAGAASGRLLPSQTLLVTCIGNLGKSALIASPSICNQQINAVLPTPAAVPRYLYYWSRTIRPWLEANSSATTVSIINKGRFSEAPIRIAPLPEQRRIVAKIDSLCTKSNRSRDHLDHIPRLVGKYKRAILAAAFQGQLTSDWRTKNAKHSWPWSHTSLGEIANIGTGSTPRRGEPRYYSNGHIPWITSGAVNAPVVQSADECITDAAIRETNCKIFPAGTLLMAMYGEGQTRGRVAVLGIEAATNQALAAIQITNNGPALRDFVLWHLRSGYLHLREQAAGGVQPNLNLRIIKAWRLPLPLREEQQEIVHRIETSFAWIDRLTSEATNAHKLIDLLDQAVLAKAFRGELVAQDPSDEPANCLLERIRAERRRV